MLHGVRNCYQHLGAVCCNVRCNHCSYTAKMWRSTQTYTPMRAAACIRKLQSSCTTNLPYDLTLTSETRPQLPKNQVHEEGRGKKTPVIYFVLNQMKRQLDATLCRFYFCGVTLHVSGVKRPGVFKTSTAATGTCVIVAGKSSHLLIRAGRP